MNAGHVQFELSEASKHLDELIAQFCDGRLDSDCSPELAVDLGHIVDHICFAWNSRNFSPEQLLTLSDADYEEHANSVPNFGATRLLGEVAC